MTGVGLHYSLKERIHENGFIFCLFGFLACITQLVLSVTDAAAEREQNGGKSVSMTQAIKAVCTGEAATIERDPKARRAADRHTTRAEVTEALRRREEGYSGTVSLPRDPQNPEKVYLKG